MKKRDQEGEEDAALWKRVAETVRPIRKKSPAAKPAARPARSMSTGEKNAAKKLPVKTPDVLPPLPRPLRNMAAPQPAAPKPFDRGEEQKLRKGPESFDGKLDLHGMTQ
ncbi:MAG TPA: hypothetical protein VEF76_12580, partial [Patescibacteria group bacterium]|nr:hypothetical protein [Patescibacteria group bacterium]